MEVVKQQDKIIQSLRDSMKRQPGISEAEMISQYQKTVKEKNNQLKVRKPPKMIGDRKRASNSVYEGK